MKFRRMCCIQAWPFLDCFFLTAFWNWSYSMMLTRLKLVRLRQAGLRLKYCSPTQGSSRNRPNTWSKEKCCLTSYTDHLSILPLSYWYSSKSKWLDTYRYSNSQMPPCASHNKTAHRVSQVDRVRTWVSLRQRLLSWYWSLVRLLCIFKSFKGGEMLSKEGKSYQKAG